MPIILSHALLALQCEMDDLCALPINISTARREQRPQRREELVPGYATGGRLATLAACICRIKCSRHNEAENTPWLPGCLPACTAYVWPYCM